MIFFEGQNFFVDDNGDETQTVTTKKRALIERVKSSSQRLPSKIHVQEGPSIDQIQDAREIFGDAFEFDDFEDDEIGDDGFDEDLDENGDDEKRKPKSKERLKSDKALFKKPA